MSIIRARRFRVTGRVQGVGFRAFVREAGTSLGLNGWVRNRSDGSVEAHAQGSADLLERFEGRIRGGPRWATVRSVEVLDAAPDDKIEGFHIR
jgi:acylphosphatase